MPTPIQSSSVTAKLRSFFRLRGRQIFSLDETVVPIAQVEDLTEAPYRANHQVRFAMGDFENAFVVPTRNFLISITTAPSGQAFVGLAPVAGVAVIERITIASEIDAAPTTARNWTVSLVSHRGLLDSVEFPSQRTQWATDTDSARNPVPGVAEVVGQVPVVLTGSAENIIPSLGTMLRLGRFRLPTEASGMTLDVLGGHQTVIGDNVAILLRNELPTTLAGTVRVNVKGSYYPLARS